ncbi:hypothetical protein ACTFIU_008859 [Dictyostelium citrinum]
MGFIIAPGVPIQSKPIQLPSSANSNANNFYLGIDLAPSNSNTPSKLSVLGQDWTRCGWIQSLNKCTTSVEINSTPDEISMIKTFLGNDVINGIPSVVNISKFKANLITWSIFI